jgi:DNA integrity scanning protein DisA with diadenylate cyclase activity
MKKWRKMKALLAGGFLFFLVLMLAVSYYELRKILPETSMDQQRMPEDPEEAAVARMDASNLLTHASELLRIKRSVLQQLRELEEKCSAVSLDVTKLVLRVEELKFEIVKLNATAEFLRSSNRHQEITHEELKQRMSPKAVKPLRLMADSSDNYVIQPLSKNRSLSCTMEKCFDYSR